MGETKILKTRWKIIAMAQIWQIMNGNKLLAVGRKRGIDKVRKANLERTNISDQLGVSPNYTPQMLFGVL